MDKKPCPFPPCTNANPVVIGSVDLFWVECGDPACDARGPQRDTEEQAIEAWNGAIRMPTDPNAACNHTTWCWICNPTLQR